MFGNPAKAAAIWREIQETGTKITEAQLNELRTVLRGSDVDAVTAIMTKLNLKATQKVLSNHAKNYDVLLDSTIWECS